MPSGLSTIAGSNYRRKRETATETETETEREELGIIYVRSERGVALFTRLRDSAGYIHRHRHRYFGA